MSYIANKLLKTLKNVDLWAIIYVIAMIIPNVLLNITEQMNIWGKIANIIVPASIYLLLVSKVKRTGAIILWLSIMMVMNAFQIVLYYLYGESIIAIDMLINCVTTNTDEAGELLSNLLFPIIINIVIYVPILAWAIYASLNKPSLRSSENFRSRGFRIGLSGLATGIVFAIIATIVGGGYSVGRSLYPFNVISNIGSALNRIYTSTQYDNTSSSFTYNATVNDSIQQPEILVLVLGETSRVGNWEIFGYDRQTNPKLSQRNDLIKFSRAVSQSNTTHKCVPLMLTPIEPHQFDSINYYKCIVSAFDEVGFKTSFFSNQAKNHSYTQFFSESAHNCRYLEGDSRLDHYLVEYMKKEISDTTSSNQFIILHTYGSHFNYKDRYTEDFSYFKPDGSTNANPTHRDELINAYDNSIRYIDNYLNDAIQQLQATGKSAVLIYCADHGEDIFDDERERFLHASPVSTYWQLHVPMFVWMSDAYKESNPDILNTLEKNKASYFAPSQSIFHTLLDIAGISTKYYNPKNSIASPQFESPSPVYLNDYNEAVPLEKSGLKQRDIEEFQKIGIL